MFEQKARSLAEWVDIYEKKTKDKADFPPDFRLFYLAERGFALMKPCPEDKMLIVYEVCGDAKFWRDYAELTCCGFGFEYLATICTRHPKPYIRSFGWTIMKEECKDGQYRFICKDQIGRLIVLTHMCINENTGEAQYFVTHYLNKKATSFDDLKDISPFL